MKKIYILTMALGFTLTTQAQNFQDIVRFSQQTNYGTARVAAMGGAFSALGGDLSAISNNPAGIGVFRKSEIGFTPFVNVATTKSGDGAPVKSSFQVGDLGLAISLYSPNLDWKGINFGINYTNLNNFNRKTRQLVNSSYSSWTDALAAESYGIESQDLNGFTTGLAYDAYLINYNEETNSYTSVLDLSDTHEYVAQLKNIDEDGYQGEYSFSFGTNYKDKLYLGMSIGIQSIYYKMNSIYQEALAEDSPSELDYYTFQDYKKISGVGTNLKFGVIYRPIPEIRIGASLHTPTWYSMNYDMSTRFNSYFLTDTDVRTGREDGSYDRSSFDHSFDYDMRTPWRAILGLATILGQKTIISADYEFIKYKNAKYSNISDDDNIVQIAKYANLDIKDFLRPTHNFRVGAEHRLNSIVSLRAGYAFWDSPYHETKKSNNRIQSISAGLGLNFGVFYCDAAYVHKYSKNQTIFYSWYNPEDPNDYIVSDAVSNKYYSNEARITLGVRF